MALSVRVALRLLPSVARGAQAASAYVDAERRCVCGTRAVLRHAATHGMQPLPAPVCLYDLVLRLHCVCTCATEPSGRILARSCAARRVLMRVLCMDGACEYS